MTYAADHKLVFTRYADDLSFSSKQDITPEHVEAISTIIQEAGFAVNPEKVKIFGEADTKIVTGLVIAEKVELAPDFLTNLSQEISQLHHIMTIQNQQGELTTTWVEQFKLQIRGRLNFAGFVLGRRNAPYQQLKDAFYTAINPPEEEFCSISWRSFPYSR
jgi:RNA-directed DNA polymerase